MENIKLFTTAEGQRRFAIAAHLLKRERKINAMGLEKCIHLLTRAEAKDPASGCPILRVFCEGWATTAFMKISLSL